MKKNKKRLLAGICAAVLCFGTAGVLPVSALELEAPETIQAQAGELQTRNVHIQLNDVNTWESEHFKFYWGNSGADSSRISESFLQENARNLEACWDVYMNDLSMNPPTQSVNAYFRDGNEYKVNFYIHNTGLKAEDGNTIETDWAYMGYDREGYAFMFCCVDAMQNNPNPSWVLPHEFGHVVTAHQYGWNDNKYVQSWWEAIANWYREQFLYSDYYSQWASVNGITDYFETYMKNLHFTPILGRDNYASWAFLQYLTENPDNLGNYGSDFMKTLMQQGQTDEYPYKEIERLGNADIKETLGNYAKRLATLDFAHQDAYQNRQNQLLAAGEWSWNQIYTLLEKSETFGKSNIYTVPTERAPQQFGVNIIPLQANGGTVTVKLAGLTAVQGADWRACLAVQKPDGSTVYSDLFKSSETASIHADASDNVFLVVTATPDSDTWQENGVPWAYGEGEFDENNRPFLGKTRYPYAVMIDGAEIKQHQDSAAAAQGSYHSNGGGFVAATAHVDDSVYVGKNARVLGYATVSSNARIDGYATVTGAAKVSGNAIVNGHAVVAENATVKDNAIISDSAGVMGDSVISDNARVLESALVYNNYTVSGNATIKGTAFCLAKGAATNQAMPDGDYYDDSSRTISAGSVYGWASPDAYVNSRPYNDGQVAGLEFDTDSSYLAADTFTSTYGITAAAWDAEKTSGKGVLTFDSGEYLIADSSYAALHDADYQTAVLIREDGDIFHFGTLEKYLRLTTDNGALYLTAADGTKFETLEVKDAYEKGKWTVISVIISGDTVKVNVNGETKASGTMTIDPVDIISEDAVYHIGSGGLSMDFFRVNYKEVAEPEYYYTETEDITETPTGEHVTFYAGDLDGSQILDVFDLALLKRAVANGQELTYADCDNDGKTGVGDIITLQKYLLGYDMTAYPVGKLQEVPASGFISNIRNDLQNAIDQHYAELEELENLFN